MIVSSRHSLLASDCCLAADSLDVEYVEGQTVVMCRTAKAQVGVVLRDADCGLQGIRLEPQILRDCGALGPDTHLSSS